MTIVADQYGYVIGVDTHSKTHSYAILHTPDGRWIDESTFPTTDTGLARALAWVGRRTGGQADVLFAIEGAGSYGAILAARATVAGYRVTEAPTPVRSHGSSKTDQIDARQAATSTAAMPVDRLRDWRSSRTAVILNTLVTARDSMTTERTAHLNGLTALTRVHRLGLDTRTAITITQIKEVALWRTRDEDDELHTARAEAVRLARRIRTLDDELKANKTTIAGHVARVAPVLLAEPGVGPITAAIILVVWSHPGRIRTADAFAKIAGTCPIPASSGNTDRHRLNRGGDRRLNRALHTITLTRMRSDERTLAYIDKRTADGKTKKDIQRILKNRIARHLYRTLNRA